MTRKKGREPLRLVEPVSLLGLGDVLLGLMEKDEGQPEPAPADQAAAGEGPVLRIRMPDGRVVLEPLLAASGAGSGRAGSPNPRVVTRREGPQLACKLYRIEGGRALYAGVVKAAGARTFVEAAPEAAYRYRNAPLRRMTAVELAAAVDPGRVHDYDLLGAADV